MIEADRLSKRYGDRLALDDLSFTVRPGVVTGFLGPNGAGKSTTMRVLLGLDRPAAGFSRINGKPYTHMRAPMREVGAMLEARSVHSGRSARNHLRALAATTGISRRRVDEVLGMVGLDSVAGKRAGGFSLGMGQRLGIASALLADPETLLLDEPVNGLDPEGVLWIRTLLKELADEGRTVFVSSHLMSEMALTASQLVVIGRGRLLADITVSEMLARSSGHMVRVRTAGADRPAAERLATTLAAEQARIARPEPDVLEVSGLSSDRIGRIANDAHVALAELTPITATLEEAFMQMTGDAVEYSAAHPTNPRGTS